MKIDKKSAETILAAMTAKSGDPNVILSTVLALCQEALAEPYPAPATTGGPFVPASKPKKGA